MPSLRSRALAVTAALVLVTLSAGFASADGGVGNRNAENTYTKWLNGAPNMSGFVGGDVGNGTFSGTVLAKVVSGTTVTIDAVYRFSGSIHSFTADVHVVQTGLTIGATSVITGRVTDGWLKDNEVSGHYLVITCSEAPNGVCFTGEVDILRGTKPAD